MMADLLIHLPDIYKQYPQLQSTLDRHLPTFEQHNITTVDLVTLEPRAICQRVRISITDVQKIVAVVVEALNLQTVGPQPAIDKYKQTSGSQSADVPSSTAQNATTTKNEGMGYFNGRNMEALSQLQTFVEFGDSSIDMLLHGGVMTGSMVEIVGESGVGKTQFLLRLCFSIQQPPHNRSAVYICTESLIATNRMNDMLTQLQSAQVLGYESLSLDRIQTAMCQYLGTLEHIIRYQLPLAIERHNVGLVIVDSIAANFRVEDDELDYADGGGGATKPKVNNRYTTLMRRGANIVRLGTALKELALKYNVAVVVANQVSDKFEGNQPPMLSNRQPPSGTPLATQEQEGSQNVSRYNLQTDDLMMTYDYQAKWFTGWGDDMDNVQDDALVDALKMKTPALGMYWTNLLDGRIALLKGSMKGSIDYSDGGGGGERARRWMKVVFLPWAESGVLHEYEIWKGGVRSVNREIKDDTRDS